MTRTTHRSLAVSAAALIALGAAALPAQAAGERMSATLFGQSTKVSGQSASGALSVGFGYLFNDSIEGDLRLTQIFGGSTLTTVGLGGKYYLGGISQNKVWLPYARAGLAKRSGGGQPDANIIEGGVGMDLPLRDALAFTAEAQYQRTRVNGDGHNGTQVFAGLKWRF